MPANSSSPSMFGMSGRGIPRTPFPTRPTEDGAPRPAAGRQIQPPQGAPARRPPYSRPPTKKYGPHFRPAWKSPPAPSWPPRRLSPLKSSPPRMSSPLDRQPRTRRVKIEDPPPFPTLTPPPPPPPPPPHAPLTLHRDGPAWSVDSQLGLSEAMTSFSRKEVLALWTLMNLK